LQASPHKHSKLCPNAYTDVMKKPQHRPILLVILDGFGYSEKTEHNAIRNANTPHLDRLWNDCPHTLLSGSGLGVGLPAEQMGNSEVGHLNMGAGRIVYQEYTRITKAIKDGSFFQNPVFVDNIDKAIQKNKAVHIFGLLSPGGVHSHVDHILAMVKLAAERSVKKLYVHAFLDGRDTPPKSAAESIKKLESKLEECGAGKIASLCGRYYVMDRDQRWERVEPAYELLTEGKAAFNATSAMQGLENAYARGENDEFVKPTAIHADNEPPVIVDDGDVVIFMNFRADRTREITRCFIEKDFTGFKRHRCPNLTAFICLTEYKSDFDAPIAFTPVKPNNVLGEYLANHHLKQLRIAETEKYAHVTFFFNGGIEKPFDGEDRELIPSPKVATYDLQPEMNAKIVTDKLVEAIKGDKYDCIICNYANADMVGHTGNYDAAIKAIECLDECLGRLDEALKATSGEMLITADHGNADCMYNEKTGQAHTAHTTNPVPLIYVGRKASVIKHDGILADITPTILSLMNLEIPQEMTGKPIFKLDGVE